MQPFNQLTSIVLPLPISDIDTDQIIPASYLKVTDKSGLADGLFSNWRYSADQQPDPSFPLNQPAYKEAKILFVGDNFGCGSSREHAPWALIGWGIRAVISTSFADIFRNNALKNGLLPVEVLPDIHQRLDRLIKDNSNAKVTIDLASQELTLPDGSSTSFSIDAFNKTCLLNGVDSLGYLLQYEASISEYEENQVIY